MVLQYTPTGARKNLYKIIKEVNDSKDIVEILPATGTPGVAVVPLADWRSIRETMLLEQVGVMDAVRKREKDDSGFTPVDDLDWDEL